MSFLLLGRARILFCAEGYNHWTLSCQDHIQFYFLFATCLSNAIQNSGFAAVLCECDVSREHHNLCNMSAVSIGEHCISIGGFCSLLLLSHVIHALCTMARQMGSRYRLSETNDILYSLRRSPPVRSSRQQLAKPCYCHCPTGSVPELLLYYHPHLQCLTMTIKINSFKYSNKYIHVS